MMQTGVCGAEAVELEDVPSKTLTARLRILVVDDDEAVRSAFDVALAGFGCDLGSVDNGRDALDYLAQNPVDLVFLDLRMPGIDGVRTLRLLRKLQPNTKVCVLTAFVEEHMPQLIDLASERLDFELFRKPLDIDEIRALTLTMVEPKRSSTPRRRKLGMPAAFRSYFSKLARVSHN